MHNGTWETSSQGAASRALVPLEAPAPAATPAGRPLAGFLTQLIACERRLPPYRARARAEPETATGSYAAADAPRTPRARLDRSL